MTMRKQFTYAILLLLAAAAIPSCSQAPAGADGSGTNGSMALKIAGTRAETAGEYDPMEHLLVRIYNDDTNKLLRRYTSEDDLPERLELLGGSYRVAVEAGEEASASFTKRFYKGEQVFEITAGATTPVEVLCKRTSVSAQVQFEESVAANFGENFLVWVAAADGIDEQLIGRDDYPALRFTADARGYFTLPEGMTTLAWKFKGTHTSLGEITKEGRLTGLKAGDNCSLRFRFSPDLPGFIECFTITVDPGTDDEDDTIIWTEISIEGDGFDMEQRQDYIPGKTAPRSYKISNATPIGSVTLEIDGQRYDVLNGTAAGITTEQPDERHLTLTLSDDFFAGRAGGTHALSILVTDSAGGKLERSSSYRLQGLLPIGEADCDLWHNTLTLRALVLDPDIGEVSFTLRNTSDEGEKQHAGVRGDEGIFTATFAPEWTETKNDAGLTVYKVDTNTGLFPGRTYEYKALLDGKETSGSVTPTVLQPISHGDMEDGSISAYSTSNTQAPFWGSGNNSFTSSLCGWSTHAGMGGEHCTKLAAALAPFVNLLAAGNFFTGTFTQAGTGGNVDFGQDYVWKARPTGLKLKYHAKVGTVDKVKHAGAGVASGEQDISVIFVAIVDWKTRHRVSSSTSGCSGMWSPDNRSATDEGAIIGYGIHYITESTPGDTMADTTIPIQYYDTQARPEAQYKLVISCSTSLYGDYMTGCSSNELYLDDFEWAY